MTGSWHLYRRGSRWRQAPHLARVVLETGDIVAVCFRAPRVELLPAAAAARHEILVRLGPDIMAEEFDTAEARARLRAAGGMPIGAALLDQSRLAGVGNVYKSEALFLAGLSPFAPVSRLDDGALDRVIAAARRQMRRNRDTVSRRTTSLPVARHWVYRRSGRPCLRCGTTIERRMQGHPPRSTYFCPRCQR